MSYLASHEEGSPQQYKLKVMSELLTQAHIAGLDLEEFVGFFATQIQAMLASPPNYMKFGEKKRVWVMRGFYPDSGVFFKLTLTPSTSDEGSTHRFSYFAKASSLRVMRTSKKGYQSEACLYIDGSDLNDNIVDRMENSFFGANHEIKPIVVDKPKMPRCMSPKGMKLFTYKKPKKAKNAPKSS